MKSWMQRARVLAASLTLLGGVNLLEAAPVGTDPGLRPCTELEMCEAFGYGADACASLNEPYHNYCPSMVLSCGVSEIGHIYWIVSCTDYETEPCPTVMPCG
jgi:hypothetical protein